MDNVETNDKYCFSNSLSIMEIDNFVKMVVSTTTVGFLISRNENSAISLVELSAGRYFCRINYYLSLFDEYHVYAEHIQLFHDACTNLGIVAGVLGTNPYLYYPKWDKTGAEIFNDMLQLIRQISDTIEFKKKVYARQYNGVRNYQSCLRYVDALFAGHSRFLVLRVDFGYRKGLGVTIAEAQHDIEHYLNNRRGNRLFDTRIGYIIKLEFTVEKGPHFHCFFFLDGSMAFQDPYLAQEYCNYWMKLTEGRGVFFNCNMKKHEYDYCGVGMIHHADTQMRANLLLPIRYITKSDQCVKVKVSPKSRTFWRGEMPAVRATSVGRPRNITQMPEWVNAQTAGRSTV
jgi:hypothetical protein